jgi:acyl-CoA reductase-like NAD-dependent aldehyde dehydrogenase
MDSIYPLSVTITIRVGARNQPLQSAALKSTTGLVFGNRVGFKWPEETQLTALQLAEVGHAAGVFTPWSWATASQTTRW